ncbi:MAG: hypothetical protein ACLRSV_05190 [Oscillospiraceae bacterium]
MTDCTSCGGCAGGCGGCRSHVLLLTEPELRLLRQFAELAFLPAACTRTDETPVYLDGSRKPRADQRGDPRLTDQAAHFRGFRPAPERL